MFTSNPFVDLAAFLPPLVMQVYVVLMIFAVAIGTLFDMLHKGSAKFFIQQRKKSKAAATRELGVSGYRFPGDQDLSERDRNVR